MSKLNQATKDKLNKALSKGLTALTENDKRTIRALRFYVGDKMKKKFVTVLNGKDQKVKPVKVKPAEVPFK
jgi:hypothetical protein